MKRILSLLLVILIAVVGTVTVAFAVAYNDGVADTKTPIDNVKLKYAKKMGSGYKNAPTAPVVYDDYLIVLSGGKLYKLNADNGKEISSVSTAGTNQYTTVSPCVANGMIFVQLDGGKVQAFDMKTMKSLWVYTDALKGQALCDIVYSGGYVYTGFWNGETNAANYVCLTVKDENTSSQTEAKKAKWTYKNTGGFYWSSACVSGNYVIFGCDNGKSDSTSASKIVSLNKTTGKQAGSLSVNGDIRSGVAYNSELKRYFVSSKAGYVYSFAMNSSTGALSGKKSLSLSGAATATPVVYNGRLYVGCANGSAGRFYVADASTMKTIYFGTLDAYPQAMPLLSTGYIGNGKVYVYITCNAKPGSVFMFTDEKGQNTVSKTLLYSPDSAHSEYCISRITAGENGDLYYKNDSGTIFALTGTKTTSPFANFINIIISLLKSIFGIK